MKEKLTERKTKTKRRAVKNTHEEDVKIRHLSKQGGEENPSTAVQEYGSRLAACPCPEKGNSRSERKDRPTAV